LKSGYNHPRYAWVVLGLAWLAVVALHCAWYVIPSLASQLIIDLHLTSIQYTLLLTAPTLIGIFASLPSGALGDRYGIKRVVSIALILASISCIMRAFTPNFISMFIMMLLLGFSMSLTISNLPKIVSVWFSPRLLGITTGIYVTGMGLGLTLGLLSGPLFNSWHTAFLFIGAILVIISILWIVFSKSNPVGAPIHRPSILAGVKVSVRNRNIWMVALSFFLFQGAFIIFTGNFPQALEKLHNMSPKTAGRITSLLTFGLTIGNIVIPFISDRVGLRKPFVMGASILGPMILYFSWALAPNTIIYLLIFVSGVILGAVPPLLFTFLTEFPEIGPAYIGGAGGLVNGMQGAGGFILPLIVTSLVLGGETFPVFNTKFIIAFIVYACVAVPIFFIAETGLKARCKK